MCGPAEALDAGGVMKLALKSAKDNQTGEQIHTLCDWPSQAVVTDVFMPVVKRHSD